MKRKQINHWLVKSEPDAFSWSDCVRDGRCRWDGVRNYQARNNLRTMRAGDLVLFYHSVTGKEIVGIMRVTREAYPDPTAREGDWSCVEMEPVKPLRQPVTLEVIKTVPELANLPLLRHSRLSVMPVSAPEFEAILRLAGALPVRIWQGTGG